MMETAHVRDALIFHQQTFKDRVCDHCVKDQELQVLHDVKRAGENHKMNENGCQIDEGIDRVHRYAGSWTNVDIPMMDGMHGSVERLPMEEAMHPVVVERVPDRNQK